MGNGTRISIMDLPLLLGKHCGMGHPLMQQKVYLTGTVLCGKNRPCLLVQKQKSVAPNLTSRMIRAVQFSNFQDGTDMYEKAFGFRI